MVTYPNWPQSYGVGRPTYSNNQQLRIRPVSSIEEVKASPIDFDGSIFFFHDVANKKIYTKQINLEGMVQIDMYGYQEITQPQPTVDTFITKEEFQKAMQEILTKLEGVKQNESTRNDTELNF